MTMTVEEFAKVFTKFMRQSIIPKVGVGLQRGLMTAFVEIVDSRPAMAQNLINQVPFIAAFGIVTDGKVDVELAKTAIKGFFLGGNTYTLDMKIGEYVFDAEDAEKFSALLPVVETSQRDVLHNGNWSGTASGKTEAVVRVG